MWNITNIWHFNNDDILLDYDAHHHALWRLNAIVRSLLPIASVGFKLI